jgi:trk system potassium uptake protein TrkA
MELSDEVSLIELDVKREWVGKSLVELNIRKKYNVNVIAIKENDRLTIDFDPNMKLTEDMNLVIIAHSSKINKLK